MTFGAAYCVGRGAWGVGRGVKARKKSKRRGARSERQEARGDMVEAGRQLSHPQPRPELERECACEPLERAWFGLGFGSGLG